MSMFEELKRRNVVRVGIAYLVMGWIILQILDVVVEPLQLPEWTATFVIVLLVIGLPIALFFSWAFELTPQGVKRTEEVDSDASITPSTGRRLNFFIGGALALSLGFIAYQNLGGGPAGTESPANPKTAAGLEIPAVAVQKSIAVLPFVNMSSDPEQEFFADGVAEEILNRLAQTGDLRVISRSSSFTFKGRNVSIPEVAAALKVSHVLEGSVRRAGNRVRITAQLIEVGQDAHLWSKTFDRELTDIFALEDEIAGAIATALRVKLGLAPAPAAPSDMGDYDLLLKAKALVGTRDAPEITEAVKILEELADRLPDYGEAQAQFAFALLVASNQNVLEAIGTREAGFARADQVADRALALDERNVTALVVKASLHMYAYEFEESERLFLRALEISPNSGRAHNWYGDLLNGLARMQEAVAIEQRAVDLDPLLAINHSNLAVAQENAGLIEEALASFRRSTAISGDPPGRVLGVLWRQGRIEGMRKVIADWTASGGSEQRLVFYRRIVSDEKDEVLDWLAQIEPSQGSVFGLTMAYALLGEFDRVAPLLEDGSVGTAVLIGWHTLLPTNPEVLAANPKYAAFWRTPPRDKLLKARGHWVEEPGGD